MTEKTKSEIQIMRGIALLLVVFHHIMNSTGYVYSSQIVSVVASIHVQTFFLISGFLFEYNLHKYKQNGIKSFLKKKARELIVPYFCWIWLLFILVLAVKLTVPSAFEVIEEKGFSVKPVLEQILDSFVIRNPQIESLWFIYVLFFIFLLNWFLPVKKYKWAIFAAAVVISSVASYYFYDTSILLPYRVIKYFQWFYLGRICVSYQSRIRKIQNSLVCRVSVPAAFLVFGFLEIFNPIRIMVTDKIVRAVFYSIQRPILTATGIMMIAYLASLLRLLKTTGKIFKFIGDQSYPVYLIHNPWVVVPTALIVNRFLPVNIIIELAALAVIVLISIGIGLIMKKSRYLSMLFLGTTKLKHMKQKI